MKKFFVLAVTILSMNNALYAGNVFGSIWGDSLERDRFELSDKWYNGTDVEFYNTLSRIEDIGSDLGFEFLKCGTRRDQEYKVKSLVHKCPACLGLYYCWVMGIPTGDDPQLAEVMPTAYDVPADYIASHPITLLPIVVDASFERFGHGALLTAVRLGRIDVLELLFSYKQLGTNLVRDDLLRCAERRACGRQSMTALDIIESRERETNIDKNRNDRMKALLQPIYDRVGASF